MNNDRASNFASVMIAVVTVLGATMACLATVVGAQAGQKDFDGLTASIRAEEAIIINHINAYEHKRAYTTYYHILVLSNKLREEMDTASNEEYAELLRQYNEITAIAGEMRHNFFSTAYINNDNTYNVQRELNEAWADDQQTSDLNADFHFAQAAGLRSKSLYLTGNLIVLSAAFFFFTLAEVIKNRWRILFFVLGFLALFTGIMVYLIVEVLS
jgi:hypothetical protein